MTELVLDSSASEAGIASVEEVPECDEVEAEEEYEELIDGAEKWPGWPGDNVYRLIIPFTKVGSIIGRKGELVKKMCDETRARIRILEAPPHTPDRVVLISGKEEPEVPLSPAMDAAIRIFKRVSGLSTLEVDGMDPVAATAFCSIRLLTASSQAINLIGRQGSTIKSIQENSGAVVRVLSEDEAPLYVLLDERIVEIHGEAAKVLKAFEAVIGQLRKFLVDHSIIPVFEKMFNAAISQELPAENQSSLGPPSISPPMSILSDYTLTMKREPSIHDREILLDSLSSPPRITLYGSKGSGLGGLRSLGLGRSPFPIITQVTRTIQVPISYAEDIIGAGGRNIAYIRNTSGASLTIQESRALPDEITVEIKGSISQVQIAQQLVQECINGHRETTPNIYSMLESGFSSYSHVGDSPYPSSSSSSHLGEYRPSNLGGCGSPGRYSGFKF